MRYSYIFIIACSLSLVACNSSSNNNAANNSADKKETIPATPPQSKLDNTGTQLLVAVVNNYYSLKNAFVATNAAKADSAATQVAHAADSLKEYGNHVDATTTIYNDIKPYLDTIIMQSQVLTSLQDKTCERKRIPFGVISSAVYGLAVKAGLKNMNVFHDYCPMAFNEKGAYWISDESEIKNPYLGKKMIECGEITDSLK